MRDRVCAAVSTNARVSHVRRTAPTLKLASLHKKMSPKERGKVYASFQSGDVQVGWRYACELLLPLGDGGPSELCLTRCSSALTSLPGAWTWTTSST